MLVCCCGVQEVVKAHVQRNQDHWFMPWILPTLEKPTKLWKSTSLSFRPPSTEFSTEFFGSVSGLFWKLAPAVWTEGGSFLGNAPCPASCLPPLTFLLQRACPSSFSQAHRPSRDTVPRTPQHPFLHEAPLALPTLAQPGRQQASRPGLSLVLLWRGSLSTAHCLIFTMLVRNAWLCLPLYCQIWPTSAYMHYAATSAPFCQEPRPCVEDNVNPLMFQKSTVVIFVVIFRVITFN